MIKIVTDSVASIPADVVRERDIEVVSLYVNRDGREYRETDMDVDAFYEEKTEGYTAEQSSFGMSFVG